MYLFANLKPFKKSMFLEYPSVVRGNRFIDYEKDPETDELTVWLGRIHLVVSPGYG